MEIAQSEKTCQAEFAEVARGSEETISFISGGLKKDN